MITTLFCAYLLIFIFEQILEWLNIRFQHHHASHIPAIFKRHYDPATVHRALAYETRKKQAALIETGLSAILFAGFMFGGWLPRYDAWTIDATNTFISQGVLFFLGLLLVRVLLGLPFSWYRNFRIEAHFGFNTMPLRLWLVDTVKGLILSLTMYGMLLVGILWLVQTSPLHWWIWVWGFVFFFGLMVMVISPYLIEPLFFKFSPIEKEGLEQNIRRMAEKAGLHAGRIFQVDASRRSRHGNAYFTGLGRQKRIVLFDTLLEKMDENQILAVLAHEIGHWKHRHISRRLCANAAWMLGGLYLAAHLMQWEGLPGLLNLSSASFPAQTMILALLASLVNFALAPLGHALSRRQERQADRFACKLTGRPSDLAEALVKLAHDNLAALHPHPLYAWFHFSHPPIVQRVAALQHMKPVPQDKDLERKDNP